jgi:hypothetical protein
VPRTERVRLGLQPDTPVFVTCYAPKFCVAAAKKSQLFGAFPVVKTARRCWREHCSYHAREQPDKDVVR